MSIPIFADLQGFLIRKDFAVKEFAALKEGHVLSHYIFEPPYPWDILSRPERHQAIWLTVKHHGLRWDDGMVPYKMAKSLITKAVMGTTTTSDNIIVYVKGHEKREWLQDLLHDETRRVYVENIEAHYKDIESLDKLDVTHTFRCQKHVKNCALQNVFKIFNWWSQCQKEICKK